MALQYQNSGPVDCSSAVDFGNLRGKTVLVTGGSSGLGFAYVKAFSEAGAIVVNADLNPLPGDFASPNVHFTKCDVRSWADQKLAFTTAAAKSVNGFIDIVIANAGISGDDPFLAEIDTTNIQEPDMRIIHINLIGTMYTARLTLNHFSLHSDISPQDKCLIFKSSLAGYLDSRPSYGSTKFGLRAVMRSLRHNEICRVNIVAPWFIRTPIMGEETVKILTAQLQAQGSDFGRIEDCVHCVLRISADNSIHGRGFGIVPRNLVAEGYCDLDQDDFKQGTLCSELQRIISKVSHRK